MADDLDRSASRGRRRLAAVGATAAAACCATTSSTARPGSSSSPASSSRCFYLFSIGVGVGQLIDAFEFNGQPIPYAEFVAPGMLAASAMNGALLDSTFNVFFKLKYDKLYDQMLATPLRPATSPAARSPGACCAAASTPRRSWW